MQDRAPKDRRIALVFQSYALYPHMTCAANIAAPLRMAELSAFGRVAGHPVLRCAALCRAARHLCRPDRALRHPSAAVRSFDRKIAGRFGWGTAPMPVATEGGGGASGGMAAVILTDDPAKRQAAWAYLRFGTGA